MKDSPKTELLNCRFGKLVIISIVPKEKGPTKVVVQCDCGIIKNLKLSDLRRSKYPVKSCGCSRKESSLIGLKAAAESNFASGKWSKDPKISSAKKIYKQIYNDGDLSFDDFLDMSQAECFYCGVAPANISNVHTSQNNYRKKNNLPLYKQDYVEDGNFIYNGLDRVDNELPHNKDNLVSCCWNCNTAKSNKNQKDFIDWVHKIISLHPPK